MAPVHLYYEMTLCFASKRLFFLEKTSENIQIQEAISQYLGLVIK